MLRDNAPWRLVRLITEWLDTSNREMIPAHDDAMRVMKIGEEYGEAVTAYIGMVGQNPRKGVTHTRDDLLEELADVAVTALCAIQHFTGDITETEELLNTKLAYIWTRANAAMANGQEG